MGLEIRNDAPIVFQPTVTATGGTPTGKSDEQAGGTTIAITDQGLTGPLKLETDPSAMTFTVGRTGSRSDLDGPDGGVADPEMVVEYAGPSEPMPETVAVSALMRLTELQSLLKGDPSALSGELRPLVAALGERLNGADLTDFDTRKQVYQALMALRQVVGREGDQVPAGTPPALRMALMMTSQACIDLADVINQGDRMAGEVLKDVMTPKVTAMATVDALDQPLSELLPSLLADRTSSGTLAMMKELAIEGIFFTPDGRLTEAKTGKVLTAAETDAIGKRIQQVLVNDLHDALGELDAVTDTYFDHCDGSEIMPLGDLEERIRARSKGEPPQNPFDAAIDLITDIASAFGTVAVEPDLIGALTGPGVARESLPPAIQEMLKKVPPEMLKEENGLVRLTVSPEQRSRLIAIAKTVNAPTSPAAQKIVKALLDVAKTVSRLEGVAKAIGRPVAAIVAEHAPPSLLGGIFGPGGGRRARRHARLRGKTLKPVRPMGQGPKGTTTVAPTKSETGKPTGTATTQPTGTADSEQRREAQFAQLLRERPDDLAKNNKAHRQAIAAEIQAEAEATRKNYEASL